MPVSYIPRRLRLAAFVALALTSVRIGNSQTANNTAKPVIVFLQLEASSRTCHSLPNISATHSILHRYKHASTLRSIGRLLSLGGSGRSESDLDGWSCDRTEALAFHRSRRGDRYRTSVLASPPLSKWTDRDLTSIQSIELPSHRFSPSIQRLDQQDEATVSMDGKDYRLGGRPLELINQPELLSNAMQRKIVFTFSDGQVIVSERRVSERREWESSNQKNR